MDLLFLDKTLGYSGGAVPESHRVPCTSALPQERPTTNAQFKRPVFYRRRRKLSSGSANQYPLQPPPVHGHNFQRQSLPVAHSPTAGIRPSTQSTSPPTVLTSAGSEDRRSAMSDPFQQFVQRHAGVNDPARIVAGDDLLLTLGTVFVVDLAHQLFQHVFHRHQALRAAEFVQARSPSASASPGNVPTACRSAATRAPAAPGGPASAIRSASPCAAARAGPWYRRSR